MTPRLGRLDRLLGWLSSWAAHRAAARERLEALRREPVARRGGRR